VDDIASLSAKTVSTPGDALSLGWRCPLLVAS
jgi:hypothetical protein